MMITRILVCFLFMSFCRHPAGAQSKRFDFNTRCRQAYHDIMMMKLNSGTRLLQEEEQADPNNLAPYFLDNYADFFRLFFSADPQEYNRLKGKRDQRLAMMDQGDPGSPYYLYTKAVIHFQWAIVKIVFEEYWPAAWEFRRSYLLIKDNYRRFPAFGPNKMLLGAMQAVMGTVPDGYKWATNILGMSGSISKGMSLLKSYVNDTGTEGELFKEEAYFYYASLKFYIENKPEEALQFIRSRNMDLKNNPLYALVVVNLAINHYMGGYGLKVIEGLNNGPEYLDMPVMNFEAGMLKLDHLEIAEAIRYLEEYVNNFKGKFYVKNALQGLSWAYYLEGDMARAEKSRQLILTRGNAEADADKSALREAKLGRWPNKELLRARLLSDGGYFEEALKILSARKAEDFPDLAEKIEYAYRIARVYDQLGKEEQAIPLYEVTIKTGYNRPEYFAARAALQLGYIYEKRGEKAKAISSYRQCLGMNEKEYKNSLDQKAKAGIDRLTGN